MIKKIKKWSDERNPKGSALHAFSCQSISLFLPMDDGGLCSCGETLHPYPSIPREPFNFSIFLPNVTVLSDERDDSQITAVYNHASPQTHVHETAEQRIMGKTSE